MELTKIFVTIAMMITLATKTIADGVETSTTLTKAVGPHGPSQLPKPSDFIRVSRFLQQGNRNPRAADHCHKDEEVCYIQDGATSTCCNNKCVFLATDAHNCGACKRKCKFTQVCCRGECVDIAFDKRHCGDCNHRCKSGEYCVYGMCNYA